MNERQVPETTAQIRTAEMRAHSRPASERPILSADGPLQPQISGRSARVRAFNVDAECRTVFSVFV